jgi:putative transposon-encoded protein
MSRKIEAGKDKFILTENKIQQLLERVVTPFGNSAKADVPKKYIGKRVYVVVIK